MKTKVFYKLIIFVSFYFFNITLSSDANINIDITKIFNKIEDSFIGFTIDCQMFNSDGLIVNLNSKKLNTLVKAFSPTYLRVGGTSANWLFFDLPPQKLKLLKLAPAANILSKKDFLDLVNLTASTGTRLIFDLNVEVRYGNQWNPTNAIQLFEFCTENNLGHNIDWELGNEPYWSFPGKEEPEILAEDFQKLIILIKSYKNFNNSSVFGPDVGDDGIAFLSSVANKVGSSLKAYTFHHYYFNGKEASFKNYIDPSNFVKLNSVIDHMKTIVNKSKNPKTPLWLGETNSGYNSGTPNVSDRFVSGFLWLDKLGNSAISGINVVIRQTLFGGNYGLLQVKDYVPNPDYWLSYIYKQLVGQNVFKVTFKSEDDNGNFLRLYAHCANKKLNFPGSIVLYGLNVDSSATFNLKLNKVLQNQEVLAFHLTPADNTILSRNVLLNGEMLQMISDEEFPKLKPVIIPAHNIYLKPHTMGFFVFPKFNSTFCY